MIYPKSIFFLVISSPKFESNVLGKFTRWMAEMIQYLGYDFSGHPITARHFIEEKGNGFFVRPAREKAGLRHRSKEKACHVPHVHHVLLSLGSQLCSTIECLYFTKITKVVQ
jgi:hypothetical protein